MPDDQQQPDQNDPWAARAKQLGMGAQSSAPSSPPDQNDPWVARAKQLQEQQPPQQQPSSQDDPWTARAKQLGTVAQQTGSDDESERMGEGQHWFTKPVTTSILGWGEYRKGATGVEKGVEKFASGLLSPLSIGLMAVTAGVGGVAAAGAEVAGEDVATGLAGAGGRALLSKLAPETAVAVGKAAGAVSKLANAGFTGQQIVGVMQKLPQFADAVRSGDTDRALELGTQSLLEGTLAGLSTRHLMKSINPSKEPVWTQDKEVVAALDQATRGAGAKAGAFAEANKELIQNRPLDMAARFYHWAGGDTAKLEQWRQEIVDHDNIRPEIQRKYDSILQQAQNLSPEIQQLSSQLKLDYAQDLGELKTFGTFHQNFKGLENYAGQLKYDMEDEGGSSLRQPGTRNRAGFVKKRSFENVIEALKAGFEPKDIGLAGAREEYIRDMGGLRGRFEAEKLLMSQRGDDARPVAIDPAIIRHIDGKAVIPVDKGADVGEIAERRADDETRQRIEAMTPADRARALKNLRPKGPATAEAEHPGLELGEHGAYTEMLPTATVAKYANEHVQMVPTSELEKYREFDRRQQPAPGGDMDALKADIQKNGLQEPLIVKYGHEDHKAHLWDGNTRLGVAQELGIKELPVRVIGTQKTDNGYGVAVPGYEGEGTPEHLKPSDIGLKGRAVKTQTPFKLDAGEHRPEDFLRRALGGGGITEEHLKAAVVAEGVSDLEIQNLREAYAKGQKVEPVQVTVDKDGGVVASSGLHRAYAALLAGVEKIPVERKTLQQSRPTSADPAPGKWPSGLDPVTDKQIIARAIAEIAGTGTHSFDDLERPAALKPPKSGLESRAARAETEPTPEEQGEIDRNLKASQEFNRAYRSNPDKLHVGTDSDGGKQFYMPFIQDGKRIGSGHVSARPDIGEGAAETHRVDISEAHQGKGLAKELYRQLYEKAKEEGFTNLISDSVQSPESRRAWEGMARLGLAKEFTDPYGQKRFEYVGTAKKLFGPNARKLILQRALEMKTEQRTASSGGPRRSPTLKPSGSKIIVKDGKLYWDVSDFKDGPNAFKHFRYVDVNQDGDPIFEKKNAQIHPDYHQQIMQAFTDDSWFRKNPILGPMLKGSTQAKKSLLSFSPFHWTTEYLRGIQMGLSPLEALNPKPVTPERLAIGAKFGPKFSMESQRSLVAEGAGESASLLHKLPGVGKLLAGAEEKLFGGNGYIDRLKADSFDKVTSQLSRRHPNWSTDQVQFASSKIVDAAFGGLNWKMLGASTNGIDALRLIFLAPDFTGSQVLFAKYGLQPGGSVVGQSLARIALYNFGVARVLNMLTTGKPHMEHPFSVVSADEKKTYSIRTMPQDILHALTDPRGFTYNRLNPLLVRTAVEGVTGRDEQGKRVTYEKELHDLLRNVLPISGQNLIPGFRREGEGIGTSVLRGLGVASEPNTTSAYKLAGKLASDRSESGPVDQDKLDRHRFIMQMEDSLRSGAISGEDLNNAIYHKTISRDEAKQIYDNFKATQGVDGKPMGEYTARLFTRANRLPVKELLQVYDIATPQEKKLLLPLVEKKGKAYLKKAQDSMVASELDKDPTYHRLWRDLSHMPLW